MRGSRATFVEIGGLPIAVLGVFFVLPLDRLWIGVLGGLCLVAMVVPMTLRRVRSILGSPRPGVAAVQAIALMATALIVGFAMVHRAIDVSYPSEYHGMDTDLDGLYFTVTVLSTVGFGDIVATGQWARGLVAFQMICNMVFIGGALKLVSWAARTRAPFDRLGADAPPPPS